MADLLLATPFHPAFPLVFAPGSPDGGITSAKAAPGPRSAGWFRRRRGVIFLNLGRARRSDRAEAGR